MGCVKTLLNTYTIFVRRTGPPQIQRCRCCRAVRRRPRMHQEEGVDVGAFYVSDFCC